MSLREVGRLGTGNAIEQSRMARLLPHPKSQLFILLHGGWTEVNLLVVDDEKDQLESLRRGLRSKGYRVLEALAAGEALEHLKRKDNEIGMVLLDYAMPGMNGMELLENIRKATVRYRSS